MDSANQALKKYSQMIAENKVKLHAIECDNFVHKQEIAHCFGRFSFNKRLSHSRFCATDMSSSSHIKSV